MAEKQDVSRRDFVKTAGAAAVVSAPAIQTVKAANDQVQFGFIGTGSRGQYLLQHINQTDRGRCVAVCDIFETNLKKGAEIAGTNPKTFKDYRELLSQKDVDCVYIATPLFQHFPVTRDALLAGKARVLRKEPGVQAGRSACAAATLPRASQAGSASRTCSAATASTIRPRGR